MARCRRATIVVGLVAACLALASPAAAAEATFTGQFTEQQTTSENTLTIRFDTDGGRISGSGRLVGDTSQECWSVVEITAVDGTFPDTGGQLSGEATIVDYSDADADSPEEVGAICGLFADTDKTPAAVDWSATWTGTQVRGRLGAWEFELTGARRTDDAGDDPPPPPPDDPDEPQENRAPEIIDWIVQADDQVAGGLFIQVNAEDPDGDRLHYAWTVAGVPQNVDRAAIGWENPVEGKVVTVTITDGRGGSVTGTAPTSPGTGDDGYTSTTISGPRTDSGDGGGRWYQNPLFWGATILGSGVIVNRAWNRRKPRPKGYDRDALPDAWAEYQRALRHYNAIRDGIIAQIREYEDLKGLLQGADNAVADRTTKLHRLKDICDVAGRIELSGEVLALWAGGLVILVSTGGASAPLVLTVIGTVGGGSAIVAKGTQLAFSPDEAARLLKTARAYRRRILNEIHALHTRTQVAVTHLDYARQALQQAADLCVRALGRTVPAH